MKAANRQASCEVLNTGLLKLTQRTTVPFVTVYNHTLMKEEKQHYLAVLLHPITTITTSPCTFIYLSLLGLIWKMVETVLSCAEVPHTSVINNLARNNLYITAARLNTLMTCFAVGIPFGKVGAKIWIS